MKSDHCTITHATMPQTAPQTTLTESFAAALARHLDDVDRLVVAFSGGVDSTVLLRLAVKQRLPLVALYCNHGEAFDTPSHAWEAHCRRVCAQLKVDFHALPLTLPLGNLENSARQARYQAFADFCRAGDLLLMAHHLDDQHETLLTKLARGAARHGLLIPESRTFGRARLLRPLLWRAKEELIAYARDEGLEWVEDPGNAQGMNKRARTRRELIPVLTGIWPEWASGWRASEQALADEARALAFFTRREIDALLDDKGLALERLTPYPPQVQIQMLLGWLWACGLQPPGHHNLAVPLLLEGRGTNTSLALRPVDDPGESAWLRLYQGRLWLHSLLPEPEVLDRHWDGCNSLALPGSRLECAQLPEGGVRVLLDGGDARVRLPARDHHTSLTKLMQQLGIPTWERALTPQIYHRDRLIAIGDAPVHKQARELGLTWRPGWRLTPS